MLLRYKIYNLISLLLALGALGGLPLSIILGERDYVLLSLVCVFLRFTFMFFPYCPKCHHRIFKARKDPRFVATLNFVPPKCNSCGHRFDGKYAKK